MIPAFLITFLDLVFATWFFYLLTTGLLIGSYFVVSSSVDSTEDSPVPAGFLLAVVISAILYRYPAARHFFSDWRGWVEVVGGYIVAGFALSLYKWFMVLVDFRKLPVAADIAEAKRDANTHRNAVLGDAADRLRRQHVYRNCVVTANGGVIDTGGAITVYPDWHKHPIATWWVFFPFFLFSVILDPVKRAVEKLISWCRAFYDGLAQRFAVKG